MAGDESAASMQRKHEGSDRTRPASRATLGLRVTAGSLGLLIAMTCVAPVAQAGIEIVEHAWAAQVVAHDAIDLHDDRAPVSQPLYLWMRVRGDPAALKNLRARGKLPLFHQWVHYVGPDPDIDTLRPTDEISVGGVREALVAKLANEISGRGFFDWRTWSSKRSLRLGTHMVKIVYADGSPVLCQRADGSRRQCVFRIDVVDQGR